MVINISKEEIDEILNYRHLFSLPVTKNKSLTIFQDVACKCFEEGFINGIEFIKAEILTKKDKNIILDDPTSSEGFEAAFKDALRNNYFIKERKENV